MTFLVTGSSGFMGRNLCVALRRRSLGEVLEFDVQQPAADLPKLAAQADVVFHLAGVNRPKEEQEFVTGNTDLTRQLCDALAAAGRRTPLVLSSSTQAELDNPYGRSKKAAEEVVLGYHQATGAPVHIYRFPNVFGKWSRPNYNTVVATFCHNISRGLPLQINNRASVIRFVYIDDVVRAFLEIVSVLPAPNSMRAAPRSPLPAPRSPLPAPCSSLPAPRSVLPAPRSVLPAPSSPLPAPRSPLPTAEIRGQKSEISGSVQAQSAELETRNPKPETIAPTSAFTPTPDSPLPAPCFIYTITLGELHDLLVSFRENRKKSLLPDLSNPLVKYLYSTYVSFYDTQDFSYPVELKTDDRGWLFELIKSPQAGQIFVSRTRPGITRGNHYHDTKIEKFCVIQGEGVIRFRHVLSSEQGAASREDGAWSAELPAPSSQLSASIHAPRSPLPASIPAPRSPLPAPCSLIEYRVSDREIRIVDIPPGYAHSIENTGPTDMITLFWANEIFDPQRPDTYPMPVK